MLQYASDLHLERFDVSDYKFDNYIEPTGNVLLLIGDIGTMASKVLPLFLNDCSTNFKLTLYVPGNHEYYNDDNITIEEANIYYENLCSKYENVIFMNNKVYKYNDITFIGSILWSKILSAENYHIKQVSNDYRNINITCNQKLNMEHVNKLNSQCVKWLVNTLDNTKDENIIVLTHYLPSYRLIDDKYKNYIGNSMFANDLEYIIKKYSISYWFFGHSHSSVQKIIHNTICLSNPHGYIICGIKENINYLKNKIVQY